MCPARPECASRDDSRATAGNSRRVFGIDARLDGGAAQADVVLRRSQRLAAAMRDHLAHQIDPGDHLGDWMLDLDAGVHLDEVELPLWSS